jgi:hypothetical protein
MAQFRTDREIAKRMRSPPTGCDEAKSGTISPRGERSPKMVVRKERSKQMSHELEITLGEKYVYLKTDQVGAQVGLDEHGRPQFDEFDVEEFPRYIRELVEKLVSDTKSDPNQVHKCMDVNVDHQESCAKAKGLGKCNCDPVNVSCTPKARRRIRPKKKLVRQLGITIKEEDECVEFQFGEWVIVLDLDRNGNPLFPESVKNELPPYMRKMVEQIVKEMRPRYDGSFTLYLDPEHRDWCAEVTETGECNCEPIFFRDNNRRTYFKTLTCAVCGESTTGQVGGGVSCEEWLKWGVYRDNRIVRQYWDFSGDKYKRYVCDDCFKTFHGCGYTYDVFANTPDLKALELKNPESR